MDPISGIVGQIHFENNVTLDLNQTFQFYAGSIDKAKPSGAYIFRREPEILLENVADLVQSNKLYPGRLITELQQVNYFVVERLGEFWEVFIGLQRHG